jgi:hypothetical protein
MNVRIFGLFREKAMEFVQPRNQGKIDVIGVRVTPKIEEQIRAQVVRWIERKRVLLRLPGSAEYYVSAKRDPEDGRYSCLVRARMGRAEWSAYSRNGSSIRAALNDALRAAQLVVLPLPGGDQRAPWQGPIAV